jgi:hypothetical protein
MRPTKPWLKPVKAAGCVVEFDCSECGRRFGPRLKHEPTFQEQFAAHVKDKHPATPFKRKDFTQAAAQIAKKATNGR